jgi:NAD(P)H-dependent FMN reductase
VLKLGVVIASTRPGRVGLPVGQWFFERAKAHGEFDVQLVDLAEINLPFLDEPKHPRFRDYQHDHTKVWSALVDSLDAYVFVIPEYNYGPPATLLNALDFVSQEWAYKASSFVSYGGVSGGTRSANTLRITLTALKIVPLAESVHIPFIGRSMADGKFTPAEGLDVSANNVLDELLKWSEALAAMRKPKA